MQQIMNPARIEPCVVVLGMFDGVHLGHQALLQAGRALADSAGVPLCVCTFEPHPLEVVRPELAPPRLSLPEERAALMARYGVDILCVHDFTGDFANLPHEEFLDKLEGIYQPRAVVCGFNFSYGRYGNGRPEHLEARAKAHGFLLQVVPCVELDGDTVSSTRIRGKLAEGDIASAERLLGHPYTLTGTVIHGKELGRTIGFPTANIQLGRKKAIPKDGVYAGTLIRDGQTYVAVINFGRHPTVPEGGRTVEAHLPGQHLDLYGDQITLQLTQYLRPEIRFASLEELKEQIRRDSAATIEIIKDIPPDCAVLP